MNVAAALCIGVCCYLVAGHLVGRPPRFGRWRRSQPVKGARQQLWLDQAGSAFTPRQLWLGSCATGTLTFSIVCLVTGTALVSLVPALAIAALPRAYFARRRVARRREMQASWPDGLRDLVASIAAVRSLTQALITLASTGPEPLRIALARFPSLSRTLGTVPALEVVKEELSDPTSDRVIEVLILAYERGGQVVREILEDLVISTTKDLKVLDEIDTEGLEMRINARAVLVMPWLVLIALTLRAGPFRDFYASPGGVLAVLVGSALSAVGYLWISRLGRAQEEQRVFGSARPAALEGAE
jgi:tight adherence protein B